MRERFLVVIPRWYVLWSGSLAGERLWVVVRLLTLAPPRAPSRQANIGFSSRDSLQSQQEHLQAKYVGTGHADTSKLCVHFRQLLPPCHV